MSTTQEEHHATELPNDGASLETVIGQSVLRDLGEPDNLHAVQVRRVFAAKYRVNVFIRADAGTFKVAHSYFLEADNDGKVVSSTPQITRQY